MPVGTPFQPGVSGNLNGRPKGTIEIMRWVQRLLEEDKDLPKALKRVGWVERSDTHQAQLGR
jgi:hypothetical protein